MAEKNLIGELDMYREAGIKPNFSDIAKRYGKDRHTVAAYWRAEGGRPRDGRADRAGSFDAHIEEVAAKAQLPGVTKKGIHEWLLHRYPGENLAGYNAFTQFMRKNGIAVGASVGPEPHPRFETPPGLQLQFDWKESVRMANRDGELFEFNVFAATLGHSRRHIFIRSGARTTDDLVRCMYATIARLGGVPREWVTDNMSALVTVKGGRRLKVQRAYEFAKAAGFELKQRPRQEAGGRGVLELRPGEPPTEADAQGQRRPARGEDAREEGVRAPAPATRGDAREGHAPGEGERRHRRRAREVAVGTRRDVPGGRRIDIAPVPASRAAFGDTPVLAGRAAAAACA